MKTILNNIYGYFVVNNFFILFENMLMYYSFAYAWLNQIAYF